MPGQDQVKSSIQKLVAEFFVIVIGVLVALAVDQWRDDQDDRALEAAYASRLIGDLRVDTAEYGGLLRGEWVIKRDVLLRLFEGELPETKDAEEMLAWLDRSAWVGLVELQDAAYREMESSGRLGLLWNAATREELAKYYGRHAFLAGGFSTSPSGYRLLVYEAIPGAVRYAYHTGQDIDAALVAEGTRTLLDDPRLEAAVNAELAYLGELVERYESIRDRAVTLIHQLGEDYPG